MVDVSWVLITTSKLTLRVLRLIDCNEIAFLALHVDCSHKQGEHTLGEEMVSRGCMSGPYASCRLQLR